MTTHEEPLLFKYGSLGVPTNLQKKDKVKKERQKKKRPTVFQRLNSKEGCRCLCGLLASLPILLYIGQFLFIPYILAAPIFPNELLNLHFLSDPEKAFLWEEWKRQFRPTFFDKAQEEFRKSIFFKNCQFVANHNRQNHGARLHINEHAALTDEEFRRQYTGLYLEEDKNKVDQRRELDSDDSQQDRQTEVLDFLRPEDVQSMDFGEQSLNTMRLSDLNFGKLFAPKKKKRHWESWEVDWEKSGHMTRVKNQGKCGACWAFSSTAALESRCAIKGWNLVSLSVQELVDCAERNTGYKNDGCIGGFVSSAFDYIKKNRGVLRWENYHHYQRHVDPCKHRSNTTRFDFIKSYHSVSSNMKAAMEELENGPITAAVFASHKKFRFYKDGIITSDCPNTIDHGVTVIGFGEENGIPFWKIKNSWGPHWGENGYVRICRGCTNQYGGQCGVLKQLQAPECTVGEKLAVPLIDWGSSSDLISRTQLFVFAITFLIFWTC